MDMEKPDGTRSLEITSIKPATGASESTFDGPIEGYVRVYVAQAWTALIQRKTKERWKEKLECSCRMGLCIHPR